MSRPMKESMQMSHAKHMLELVLKTVGGSKAGDIAVEESKAGDIRLDWRGGLRASTMNVRSESALDPRKLGAGRKPKWGWEETRSSSYSASDR